MKSRRVVEVVLGERYSPVAERMGMVVSQLGFGMFGGCVCGSCGGRFVGFGKIGGSCLL